LIGHLVTLKVDALSREAEIFGPKVRCVDSLKARRVRQRVFFPEDRELLRRRWHTIARRLVADESLDDALV
jgi:hypothetical protein